MGVTVQRMVDAAVSGVMFTCNPVTRRPQHGGVNASWGLGLAVVGGEVTPDDHLVSKVTGEVVRETIADKQVQYVARRRRPRHRAGHRADDRRTARCLDAERLAALLAVGGLHRTALRIAAGRRVGDRPRRRAVRAPGPACHRAARARAGRPARPRRWTWSWGCSAPVPGARADGPHRRRRPRDPADRRRVRRRRAAHRDGRVLAPCAARRGWCDRRRRLRYSTDGPGRAPPRPPAEPAAATARGRRPDDGTVRGPLADARHLLPGRGARGRRPSSRWVQSVDAETTVCIIEVMKMMNSVPAGVSGTIVEVCAENGAAGGVRRAADPGQGG